jgi:aspartyl-tRNA(Asn)/glutamyl-tRNA(Gln) amidotransferase subunit C
MQLTHDDVRRLAQLARLKLTDSEVDRLSKQLTDILSYVDMLREVDTSGVPETCQVTGLVTVTRPDEVDVSLATPDDLLECSPLPKQDHQIRIKRIM